jgi:hypothetical protein
MARVFLALALLFLLNLILAMTRVIKYLILSILILCTSLCYSGDGKIVLKGTVTDIKSGETLPGAHILISAVKIGTPANSYGFYSIHLEKGDYQAEITYIGYQKMALPLSLSSDTTINFQLTSGIDIMEVDVIANKVNNEKLQFGAYIINMETVRMAPSMLGTPDVIKTLQLLAGVKTGNEGTAGIQVRGGTHDQNLILLDGIPVYNTNHLFGYLSAFQTEALKDVKFYKRSIPARYGGRLSSIVDISMKEGNLKKHAGNFSIGPAAGDLMVEGPIKADTASFMFATRRTWLDLPLMAYKSLIGDNEKSGYSFYDVNAKINWLINPENRVYISHYNGRDAHFSRTRSDDTNRSSLFSFNWENYTTLIRWNSIISKNLFANTSVYHSLYRFGQVSEYTGHQSIKEIVQSGLEEIAVKGDFDLNRRNKLFKFGYNVAHQLYKPEMISVKTESQTRKNAGEVTRAVNVSVFVENQVSLAQRFSINYGARGTYYQSGTLDYSGIEPRASIIFDATYSTTLHASVQKTSQPLHLLTNTALNMPTDLWVPAAGDIKPSEAWQFNLGSDKIFNNDYRMGIDVYYKPIKNIIQYKQGILLIKNEGAKWHDLVDVGNGLNYGAELSLEKTGRKISGWANYTLAWAWLKFDGINNNEFFPFKYDRRHDVNLLINYYLIQSAAKTRYFSATFKYATGNAVTIPVEVSEGITAPGTLPPGGNNYYPYTNPEYYPHPNNYRMPHFHHFDVAYSSSKISFKNNERTWKFSVYNLYNRLNPYYFVSQNDKIFQVSMLPVIPSVSYNYKW